MSPKKPSLPDKFSIKIQSSGISPTQAKLLRFEPLSPEASKKLGHKQVQAFKIPYFDMSGTPTKFYRLRYLDGTRKGILKQTDAKDQRYDQPANTINEVYLPPLMKTTWQQHIDSEKNFHIFITEGELKAAYATSKGFPTMGLGGVWCFMSKKHNLELLPIFEAMNLSGRKVYVVFDADAVTNPNVVAAENTLCRMLLKRGALPYIIRIPPLPEIPKTGLDDYLIHAGVENFRHLIENAYQFRESELLHKLNEEVVLVRDPVCLLMHRTGTKSSVEEFKKAQYSDWTYMTVNPNTGNKIENSAPDKWLKWPGRAVVDRFVYRPGEPSLIEGKFLNLWKGLPYEPIKGDVGPWKKLMDFVFSDKPSERKWFEQWVAYPLQNPGVKLFTAVLIWSTAQGTGKTLIGHTIQRLYGDNSVLIRKHELEDKSNTYAENKQFAVGEEITGSDNRALADDLKSLVTNEELRVNPKYIRPYSIISCINFYLTSNNPNALFLDDTDRRYFIHEIIGAPLEEAWYLNVYDPWFKSDAGAAALLHHFMTLDLEGFNPRAKAPSTTAKQEMIENSRSMLSHWVHKLKNNPDTVLKAPYKLWTSEDLLLQFDPEGKSRVGQTGLGVELRRAQMCKAARGVGCRTAHGQLRLWIIRDAENLLELGGAELGKLYDDERSTEVKQKKFATRGGK